MTSGRYNDSKRQQTHLFMFAIHVLTPRVGTLGEKLADTDDVLVETWEFCRSATRSSFIRCSVRQLHDDCFTDAADADYYYYYYYYKR